MNISLEPNLFCHTFMKSTANKRLKNLAVFNLLQNLHLYTQKSVYATNFGTFGVVLIFSLQLSSQTHLAKMKK